MEDDQTDEGDDFDAPHNLIPSFPIFRNDQWREFEEASDFVPVMFEWYRWVGNLCTVVAFIQPDSPDFEAKSEITYSLNAGLLSRASRLMLSIIALTHKGEFGEAAQIIHRSLAETSIKLIWLSEDDPGTRSRRLIGDGLRTELEFEKQIWENIEAAGGVRSPLEERMLGSIQRCFDAAGMTRTEVLATKRLPDMASIIKAVGWDRLQYLVFQRIGSHAVHGTWPSLLSDYLSPSDVNGFSFMPRGQTNPPHVNIYMAGARLVLSAVDAYSIQFLKDDNARAMTDMIQEADTLLMADYSKLIEKMDRQDF